MQSHNLVNAAHASAEHPATFKDRISLLGLLVLFGLAYTQAPLYYSNQNQYFLHGLADAGVGLLEEDWLANTADPTPLFTAGVAFTVRFLHEACFYGYYLVILGLYAWALLRIHAHLHHGNQQCLLFLALLTLFHAALPRLISARWLGMDYPWYFQSGVAGQYLLGPMLQPSVFGVLLIVSIAAFLEDHPYRAVVWSSLGAVVHATYLPSAGLLTLAYLVVLLREHRFRVALGAGALALLLVLPTVVHHLRMFAPTSAEAFAQAQEILVKVRIPHHAVFQRWADWIALAQACWIAMAIYLVRQTRLFLVLLIPFLLGLGLTVVQVATDHNGLALLFPWRISAVQVPVATAIVLTWCIDRVTASGWSPRWLPGASLAGLAALALGGIAINWFELGFRTSDEELPLLAHIAEHKQPGDVYLIPVQIPKPGAGTRGAISTNFTAPPKRDSNTSLIAVDLQRFRLHSGAPLFIDFKSIPYKDVEVLAWRERLRTAEDLYTQKDWSQPAVKDELARNGITHVVVPGSRPEVVPGGQKVYEDRWYRLYALRERSPESLSPGK